MKPFFTGQLNKVDRRIRWVLVFSITAFTFFLAIVFVQNKSQEDARKDTYNVHAAIQKLDNIRILVLETEAASRAYLLTKDSGTLTALYRIHKQIPDSLQTLTRYLNLSEADSIQHLSRILGQKIKYQDSFIHNQLDVTKASPARTRAKNTTLEVKRILASMASREAGRLAEKVLVYENRNNVGVSIAIFAGFMALLLILAILLRLGNDILLRKKAEEGLQASEFKYRKLIENAGVVMYTADIDGKIGFANNQVLQLTGYSSDELWGKHFSILVDPAWLSLVAGFYARQFHELIPSTSLEFLARTRNGDPVWVEQFAQLLIENGRATGFQCMVRDISEKKKIETELGQSEQQRKENEYRLLSILENTTALIFIKDLQGRYVMVNKRFKEMMSLTDEMIIGKTDFDFDARERAEYYQRSDQIIIEKHSVIETEEVVETEEGIRNLLLLKFPLLDDKRNIFGISGIATDITERVQSRLELESALQHAKEAKELQEQFLANMSHEIRTPMNGIQGMTSLLLESELSDDQREFALMIRHSLNNLTAIINDILDYSNLRAGKITIDKIAFNIHDPLDAIKIQFSNIVNRKGLGFHITLDKDLPLLIIGDPYRLKQVLVSLVDNAIKFTHQGQISIRVSLHEAKDATAILKFAVADTGIGIPSDKQQSIFDSFTKASMDISRSFGGAGLGLAISKGLVELQGGRIQAQSEPAKGSVFSFTIPYELPATITEKTQTAELKENLRGKHVLVVEDNEVNQQLIHFVLNRVGCRVEMAANGKEALALFRDDDPFDLVVMDLQMPVMDGYETTVYIRQQLHSEVPILALTATALKGEQEKCRSVGMNDFMLKPFDFDDLYRRLVHLLQHKTVVRNEQAIPMMPPNQKLYDLSMLEELDDNESILDVLTMFLQNTPNEVKELGVLCAGHNWPEVQKLSHKIKGAVAIVQATPLAKRLAEMEENARQVKNEERLASEAKEVIALFDELEKSLQPEIERLQKIVTGS